MIKVIEISAYTMPVCSTKYPSIHSVYITGSIPWHFSGSQYQQRFSLLEQLYTPDTRRSCCAVECSRLLNQKGIVAVHDGVCLCS